MENKICGMCKRPLSECHDGSCPWGVPDIPCRQCGELAAHAPYEAEELCVPCGATRQERFFDKQVEEILQAGICIDCHKAAVSGMYRDWQMCEACGDKAHAEMMIADMERIQADLQEIRDHELQEYVAQPRVAWIFLHGDMANSFDRFIDLLTRGNKWAHWVDYSSGEGRCQFGPFLTTWSDQFDCIDFNIQIGKRCLYKHLIY